MKEKTKSTTANLPNGFQAHQGRCSFDAPQKVWSLNDFDEIEIFLRSGERKVVQVLEVNWTATFLKTDVIGWRIFA